jgi:hypothetical protein
MPQIRIYYHPDGSIRRTEHRRDEIYTVENANLADCDWIVVDNISLYDAEGIVPLGAIRIVDDTVTIVAANAAAERQRIRERETGTPRLNALLAKLRGDAITTAEIRELMRLERGMQ